MRTLLSLLIFFVGLNFFPFAFAANPGGAPAGTFLRVKGEVFILNSSSQVVADPAGTRGRTTKEGTDFFVGETIQTKARSRVKLRFVEGGPKGNNEVVLGPNTTLVIQKVGQASSSKAPGTRLSLSNGKVRANVRKSYSGKGEDVFEISTPNAVAGVRGTVFSAFYNAFNKKTDFATEVGSIVARTSGSSGNTVAVKVDAGMFTSSSASSGGGAGMQAPAPITTNPKLKQAVQQMGEPDLFSQKEDGPRGSGLAGKKQMADFEEFAEASDSGAGADSGKTSNARKHFEAPELFEAENGSAAPSSGGRVPAGGSGPKSGGASSWMFAGDTMDWYADTGATDRGGGDFKPMPPPVNQECLVCGKLDRLGNLATETQKQAQTVTFSDTFVTIIVQ